MSLRCSSISVMFMKLEAYERFGSPSIPRETNSPNQKPKTSEKLMTTEEQNRADQQIVPTRKVADIAREIGESKFELEVSQWSGGALRMVYWDWRSASDVIVEIRDDGLFLVGETDEFADSFSPISLVDLLAAVADVAA